MGEQAADHDIDRLGRPKRENIARVISDLVG
jgi:hypothetical protein